MNELIIVVVFVGICYGLYRLKERRDAAKSGSGGGGGGGGKDDRPPSQPR